MAARSAPPTGGPARTAADGRAAGPGGAPPTPLLAAAPANLRVQSVRVHGHERAFVLAGSGPALLLLHGIGDSLRTWDRVLAPLAQHYTVLAPDLLGHGRSAKPRADYSLGGYANGMRDLMSVLGLERATVIGHSFGGGVAMQFAYQFPERTERVVLVASGGLGREVTPLLRGLATTGSGPLLAASELAPLRPALGWLGRRIDTHLGSRLPLVRALDLAELCEVWDGLASAEARWAFLHVLRAAVGPRGQVVTMLDRAYLAAAMPVQIVWGARDFVLPVRQALVAHEALPTSHLAIFEAAGHFPHRDDPARFVRLLRTFLDHTEPSPGDPAGFRDRLLAQVRVDNPGLAADRPG